MRYEASNEVFVAIPFTNEFNQAVNRIIAPAIRCVTINERALTERVVNRGTAGAADIHERIYDGIMHSRLVIADMTVQAHYIGDDGGERWQANSNVAYEVGLAAAWRNPEDILLLHQNHPKHQYSFDVQNLRHVSYSFDDPVTSVAQIAQEIVAALTSSKFLADQAFVKLVRSVTPMAAQLMYSEVIRCFPVVAFHKRHEMGPMVDGRTQALSDLLSLGALRVRNTLRPNEGIAGGINVVYEWTELGFRIMRQLNVITATREQEMRAQMASVTADALPPSELMTLRPEEEGSSS